MNLPASEAGAACLAAVEGALAGGGMAGVWVDVGAALAVARAQGVAATEAAALVPAAARGVMAGIQDRLREQDA